MPSTHDGEHSLGGRAARLRRSLLALVGSVAVLASALPATTQAFAAPNLEPAAEPSGVSFTLGRVTITLSGAPIKVWVTLAARATGRYADLFRTKAYRAP